jgi:hypothetical protein
MIDKMIERAAKRSSPVDARTQLVMPDGKEISINELGDRTFHMPDRTDSSHVSIRNLDDSMVRSIAHTESAFGYLRYSTTKSLFAVYDLDWYAKEVLQQTDAKIVVMGHTHKAAWKSFNNRWYANSGCWCERDAEKPPTYVTVFTQGDPAVEVAKYLGGDQKDDKLIINEITPL